MLTQAISSSIITSNALEFLDAHLTPSIIDIRLISYTFACFATYGKPHYATDIDPIDERHPHRSR